MLCCSNTVLPRFTIVVYSYEIPDVQLGRVCYVDSLDAFLDTRCFCLTEYHAIFTPICTSVAIAEFQIFSNYIYIVKVFNCLISLLYLIFENTTYFSLL